MADLNPLIRVRRHAVEQRQKFLAELYRQDEELAAQKAALRAQLAQEEAALRDLPFEYTAYFSAYAQNVKDRVADIDEDREKLATRITRARDDLREAFADLKKVEITQERREEEEEFALNRKESIELDDIGVDGFRRKGEV